VDRGEREREEKIYLLHLSVLLSFVNGNEGNLSVSNFLLSFTHLYVRG
jgi:hypothetical protein